MDAVRPRVVTTMMGDVNRQPSVQVKYGFFLDAIARRFPLVGVCDAQLVGSERLLNALRFIHPDRNRWRQRFYKNPAAFRARSRTAAEYVKAARGSADVILQINALFDSRWSDLPMPSVIYTDYTARMAANYPLTGRSPFGPRLREEWIYLEREAYKRAEYICTRSELVRDSIIQDYGISPDRVSAVGGGVNFSSLPAVCSKPRTESPVALFVGHDFFRKGGDILLRAFAIARKNVPNARLWLVTENAIAPELPLEGVEVIRLMWDRKLIADLYRHADFFVLPSRQETWGDVLLEAMAFGLPCIGVRGEAMQEIIEHERTGLIVPPTDVDALAAALTRMFLDEELRLQWGQESRRQIEARFTWDRVVERLAPFIEAAAHSVVDSVRLSSKTI